MPDYTAQINQLVNQPSRSLESYGTGTQQATPDWLKRQSEVGLGRPAESAMFRLGIHSGAGGYQQTLRDLIKGEGQRGVTGGFTDQARAQLTDQFTQQTAGLEFDIARKSDAAKTGALREMLGIEQFNINQAFQYQSSQASLEMQRNQMQLEALIANREYDFQREQAEGSWVDTAFQIVDTGLSVASMLTPAGPAMGVLGGVSGGIV
jgi:hypothetical protein